MIKRRQQLKRALTLLALVALAFIGLGFRLVDLQVWRHDELAKLAEQKSQQKIWQPARRGDILDVNGNLLATSIPVNTVWANPALLAGQHLITNPQALFARTLAPLLQIDENRLYQQLLPRVWKNQKGGLVTNQYAVLQRKVPDETWRKIQLAMSSLSSGLDTRKWKKSDRVALTNLCQSAIAADADQLRKYPNGTLAAHVLGFVASKETTNHSSELSGCDGIEKFFDSRLSGASGWRVTGVDSRNRELVALRDEDVQARDGLSVVLTIDTVVQNIVETALAEAMKDHAPLGITGIVTRPRTGEILAMASLPDFDPNDLRNADTNALRNRVISDLMEPGSTFKTIVISGALNEHIVSLNDTVFCEDGVFHYGGITLHDAEHDHFGNLTVEQVLQKSSNIGASKIGIKMQAPKLYDYMTDYGLGAFTGIPLPNEVSAKNYVRPVSKWGKYSIAQIPMGQGVAVTRLQMAMVVGAIANDGVLMRPMLVKRLQDRNGNVVQEYEPQSVRRVISETTAREMVEALKTVVTKDGTAPLAAMDNYIVAGKTGTAQKVIDGKYANDKFVISFIGFFPADDPQICISIVMDAPKEGGRAFGGALCGPVFKKIADGCASYLNIPPDENLPPRNSPQPTIVASRISH
jgi:cell division protein FtsI (penicillin-binding protein 3)